MSRSLLLIDVLFQDTVVSNYRKDLEALITRPRHTLGLPADLFSSDTLRAVVSSHNEFNGTIYQESPTLLWDHGVFILKRVVQTDNSFHFFYLISFPIFSRADFHPVYKVYQTGFLVNQTCHELLLPDTILLVDGRWVTPNCRSTPSSELCPLSDPAHLLGVPCFNKQRPKCSSRLLHSCTAYKFVNLEHGIMITSLKPVFARPIALKAAVPDHFERVNLTPFGTAYLSWHNFSCVKVIEFDSDTVDKAIRMREINSPDSNWNSLVDVINPNSSVSFDSYNDDNKAHLKGLQSIIIKNIDLQKSIDEAIMLDNNISSNPGEFTKEANGFSLFSLISLVLSSFVALLFLYGIFVSLQCVRNNSNCTYLPGVRFGIQEKREMNSNDYRGPML